MVPFNSIQNHLYTLRCSVTRKNINIEMKKIILIGGEKGGTGKTTIATNIAILRRQKGREVLVIDADPQGSFNTWSSLREPDIQNDITVMQKYGSNLANEIKKLSDKSKYDDIIIDAGGRDSIELRSAMIVADVMITPLQASQLDVWTIGGMQEVVNTASSINQKLKAYILLNKAPTNPSIKEIEEFNEVFDEAELSNITRLSSIVKDRVAYRKAAKAGLSVVELPEQDKKATAEIEKLYNEVFND